jgi:deoxyribodipyrimidine photo-lyase
MFNNRLLELNNHNIKGQWVVYVMSRDQRVEDNHALLASQSLALANKLPILVLFNLKKPVGIRSYEHYAFMLKGLEEVAIKLQQFNIEFSILLDNDSSQLIAYLKNLKTAAVIFDFSPLNKPRALAKLVANQLNCYVAVVDTHNIVPAWVVSNKQEFSAYTFRFKVHQYLAGYLTETDKIKKHQFTNLKKANSATFSQAWQLIDSIERCGINVEAKPGSLAAKRHLKKFINKLLPSYANLRNDITGDYQSGLSPYLHFGQLASLRVALETLKSVKQTPLLIKEPRMAHPANPASVEDGMNVLFEEMIVRKELADNFCFFNPTYSSLKGAPDWAKKTLNKHKNDHREPIYNLDDLDKAKTTDQPWNAAQKQLLSVGKIHGYMRMYWAKKILEWTSNPEQAIKIAIYLNDRYSIDGGDPNGYVGILWSIAGLHDRPWAERPIFGQIRYMNQAGLKSKFDLNKYLEQWL